MVFLNVGTLKLKGPYIQRKREMMVDFEQQKPQVRCPLP